MYPHSPIEDLNDHLQSLLSAGGLRLDFVFVSACHSKSTGQAFVDAGVKHVVCVSCGKVVDYTYISLHFP